MWLGGARVGAPPHASQPAAILGTKAKAARWVSRLDRRAGQSRASAAAGRRAGSRGGRSVRVHKCPGFRGRRRGQGSAVRSPRRRRADLTLPAPRGSLSSRPPPIQPMRCPRAQVHTVTIMPMTTSDIAERPLLTAQSFRGRCSYTVSARVGAPMKPSQLKKPTAAPWPHPVAPA